MSVILPENINAIIRALKEYGNIATKDIEDRHYKIGELYELRLLMFKILCSIYYKNAWKTKQHYDGTMFNDSFLVGITTSIGEATFHFKRDYYYEFEVSELERGPLYNGYEWSNVRDRLNSLESLSNAYNDTNRSVIFNPHNKAYMEWSKVIEDSGKVEGMKRNAQTINDAIRTLRNEGLIDLNDVSDGNHTFSVLYEQRRTLLRLILNAYKDLAWKSYFDINGIPIEADNKFLVGLDTPLGPVGFIINNNHYSDFNVSDITRAPLANENIRANVLGKLASIKIRRMV